MHSDTRQHCDTEIDLKVNDTEFETEERRMTGLEIKEAAISAGASIAPDFVLYLERPGRRPKAIGDSDQIRVHDEMCFIALAPDDNS